MIHTLLENSRIEKSTTQGSCSKQCFDSNISSEGFCASQKVQTKAVAESTGKQDLVEIELQDGGFGDKVRHPRN